MNRNQNATTTTWRVDIPRSSYSNGTAGRLARMLQQRSDVVMEYHDDEEVYVRFDHGKDRNEVEAITGQSEPVPSYDVVIEQLGEWYPHTLWTRNGTLAAADDTGYVDDHMQHPQPEQVINDLDMIEELATDFDMAAMLDGEFADEVADFIYDSV